MKNIFRRFILCLCILLSCVLTVQAEEQPKAQNLTGYRLFTDTSGFLNPGSLYDGILAWGPTVKGPSSLTMETEKGIGSLYIRFTTLCGQYTISDPSTGETCVRPHQFLHDFIDLEELFGYVPTTVTVSFENDVTINELTAYTPGQVPQDVQRWQAPKDGETDLILFSTHGDDEHLFFAGILPYYSREMGYQVQLVYMTDHHNNDGDTRMREILDGLWTAGVTAYPVFGTFSDFYRWGIENAYIAFEQEGVTRDDLIRFVTENIRRFRPKVVIGHDFAGEYAHGQHAVYADVLAAAVEISMDPTAFPESAETYGTWDVPKAYFHLYEENPIVMDWDKPLESFGGLTAWQVSSRHALQKHVSQLDALEEEDVTWYFGNNYTAASVGRFSPCRYGLYRSTVGLDVEKNDFFENVTTHAQDAQRLAQEEADRLAAEEEARRESEAAAQAATETQAPTETAPTEPTPTESTPTKAPAASNPDPLPLLIAAACALVISLVVLIILVVRKGKKK